MGKFLVFILGVAILMGVAYHYVNGAATKMAAEAQSSDVSGPSAPKRQLDNVREATKRIEVQGQQQADKAAQEAKTE